MLWGGTPVAAGEQEAAAMAEAFEGAGPLWAEQSTDKFEAEQLFSARQLAYPALERLGRRSRSRSAARSRVNTAWAC